MYRFKAIILNITRIRENNTRIVLLTRDYGKISCWWNKRNISGIDLGDTVEVLLSRDNNKNTLKNIDLIHSNTNRVWKYENIIHFLETLKISGKITQEGQNCLSLYDDLSEFLSYGRTTLLSEEHITLFQMRIIKNMGSMNPEGMSKNPVLRYIYDNISSTPLVRIFANLRIRSEHSTEIRRINFHSLYLLENS